MSDKIKGKITKVIDGDTFDIKVTQKEKNNENRYNSEERIRIAGIDKPELNTKAGKKAKEVLTKKLPKGTEVVITVKARDTYRRVVGTFKKQNNHEC